VKKNRHTPEQIVCKLREEAEARLAVGTSVPEMARELEKENARLKKIVAEQAVDISILKEEVSRGNF
jgi:putative transposase